MPMPEKNANAESQPGAIQYLKAYGGTFPEFDARSSRCLNLDIASTFSHRGDGTEAATDKIVPDSSVPPAILATLVTAQHFRPFQPLPMLFPPILLFSSYLNVNGYPTSSAGITGAWSAAYLVLARRRKQGFSSKFGARGLIRGSTMGVCLANVGACGLSYAFGEKESDE